MKFKYQEIQMEIGRTERSKGEGCLWTEHVKSILAAAIRERKPAIVEFDGQELLARRNPRMDSKRWMRFVLDGEILRIPHCPKAI